LSEQERMAEMSGEPVETDGIYENEWGRQAHFNRGEVFPADPQLGNTEWKLVGLAHDTHTGLAPDPRFREEINVTDQFKKHSRIYKGEQ
jgi:hypothetical protein